MAKRYGGSLAGSTGFDRRALWAHTASSYRSGAPPVQGRAAAPVREAAMTVAKFINDARGQIHQAQAKDKVADVVALLAQRRIGCVPVVEDGAVVGIFSERDVIYGLSNRGAAMLDMPVGEVMTAPAVTIERDTPILAALSMMTMRRIRHLPIVEAGQMIGFISIGDLVKQRMDRIEAEAEAMREYIQSA
jgi:CBS domain-containing protein